MTGVAIATPVFYSYSGPLALQSSNGFSLGKLSTYLDVAMGWVTVSLL